MFAFLLKANPLKWLPCLLARLAGCSRLAPGIAMRSLVGRYFSLVVSCHAIGRQDTRRVRDALQLDYFDRELPAVLRLGETGDRHGLVPGELLKLRAGFPDANKCRESRSFVHRVLLSQRITLR